MARVLFARREDLAPDCRKVWEEIESSRGGVAENCSALLNNPQAAPQLGYPVWLRPLRNPSGPAGEGTGSPNRGLGSQQVLRVDGQAEDRPGSGFERRGNQGYA